MRVLFTFTGGRGHLEPLLPLGAAAQEAGHAAAFAGSASTLAVAAERGFETLPTGRPGGPPERVPLKALDRRREELEFRDRFAGTMTRRRAALMGDVYAGWRPDAVVSDETDYGSLIAAERAGLPRASVAVLAAGGFARPELIAASLDAVRAEHGLAPDPELAAAGGELVLAPFPHAYRDPAFPLPPFAHCFSPAAARRVDVDRATVYVTLGTVFNVESGDLLSRVVEGVRELPVEVVATLGPHVEPGELGPQPPNVRVEGFVPQAEILPHAAAVVSHGGSGSVLGALTHGLPMVLVPMGADQPWNADRCSSLGAARVLDPVAATPGDVRDALAAVLAEPSYRRAAEAMRDEFAALPGPHSAVERVEQLVRA